MGFSRQEDWSGLPFPSPGDLPNPGIKPGSPASQTDALPSKPLGKPTILLQLQKKCLYVPVPLFLKLTSLRGHSGCWAPLAPVTVALEARGGDRTEPSTGQPRTGQPSTALPRTGQSPATLPGCDYQLLWAPGRSSQSCIPLCYVASPKGKRDTWEGTAMPMETAHVHLIQYPLTPDACPWGSADHAAQAHPGSWPLGRWGGMWADPAQT